MTPRGGGRRNQGGAGAGIVNNFKVTTRADFERAEHMMAEQRAVVPLEYRTGSGYDVHRLIDGDGVTLCGS